MNDAIVVLAALVAVATFTPVVAADVTTVDPGESSVQAPGVGVDVSDAAATNVDEDANETRGGNLTTEELRRKGSPYAEDVARFDPDEATGGTYDGTPRSTSLLVEDGHVYGLFRGRKLGDEGTTVDTWALYSLDGTTLEPEWRTEFSGKQWAHRGPVLADGTLYVVLVDEIDPETDRPYTLYAVDAETGEKRWERTVGNVGRTTTRGVDHKKQDRAHLTHYGGLHPVEVRDGIVYTLSVDAGPQAVVAFDAETGEEVWRYDGVVSPPELHEGRVYVGDTSSDSYGLVALDADTGDVDWSYQVEKDEDAGAFDRPGALWVEEIADGRVYVEDWVNFSVERKPYETRNETQPLYVLDADTGEEEWTFATGDRYGFSHGVAASEANTYLAVAPHEPSSTPYYVALNAETGETRWRAGQDELGDVDTSWSMHTGEEYLYFRVGSDLPAFDLDGLDEQPESAAWVARVDFSEAVRNRDTIDDFRVVGNRLYLLDRGGTIWVFDTDDGKGLYHFSPGGRSGTDTAFAVGNRAVYVETTDVTAYATRIQATAAPPGDQGQVDGGDPADRQGNVDEGATRGDDAGSQDRQGDPGPGQSSVPLTVILGMAIGFVMSLGVSVLAYLVSTT